LGLRVSSSHDIGKSALSFYSLRASQYARNNTNNYINNCKHSDNNNNNNEKEVSQEYLTDNSRIDREEVLTDDNAYSEAFRDDFNSGDRFTS
jgi:hypothetical protein